MDQDLADLLNEGKITYDAALERVQDLETFTRLARRRQGE
jgi:Tfp pilus assembly ATPase PilU